MNAREVEIVEELDALPVGSIILDVDGDPRKKRPDGQWLGFLSVEESKTLFWGHMEKRPLILHGEAAQLLDCPPEQDRLRRIPSYPACATCDGGGCGDCS